MNSDPLDGLRDLHLPPDPGWWPPAPAFGLIAGLVLAISIVVIWRQHRRPSLGQLAWRELRAIERGHRDHRDDGRLLTEVARLMRRVTREQHGAAVAALGGEAWAAHLERHAPAGCDPATWRNLAVHRYQARLPCVNARVVLRDTRRWLARVVP